MGYTIEDMLAGSGKKYHMNMVAGDKGWSNSISWLIMIEDFTVLRNFSGKELAVTTGLGFREEDKLMRLVKLLSQQSAAGLIINTGYYIMEEEIPDDVKAWCSENALPLITVPWDVYLVDMIKDISFRVFTQGSADLQISTALIQAISDPFAKERYVSDLLPYFDLDGSFQVALITTEDLDKMDTVDRKRLEYRIQIYLMNISHNGHFFYYDSNFVLVMNAIEEPVAREIISEFAGRAAARFKDTPVYIGAGSRVNDITNLGTAYRRARAAAEFAMKEKKPLVYFDEIGIYRLLYSVEDKALLEEMYRKPLKPLIDYDIEHNSNYEETLEEYLASNGSVNAVSEKLFIHRNTILYRIRNIKKMLGCELKTPEERLPYQIAFMIREIMP
ncbi:MAG: PucR family transcriptional regulator ligand-binding domain-containing protein [Lachnospiraceae bacterium]|nr:PucR family transcriptional regulator ligand-binding domain-containing protein [Lachnospiraceae bacterium]